MNKLIVIRQVRLSHLLGLLLSLSIIDVEEADLVGVLGGGDDTEPITDLGLLEELLNQVLEVALGEGSLSLNDDLGLLAGDLDRLSELAGLSVNLDAGLQEVGKVLDGEEGLSGGGLNDELDLSLLNDLLLLLWRKIEVDSIGRISCTRRDITDTVRNRR